MDWWSALFPKRCLGCNEWGSYLCADCVNKLEPLKQLYCPNCRKPSLHGATHLRCRKSEGLDGLISFYEHSGLVRRAVVKFKYSFVSDLKLTILEMLLANTDHPQLWLDQWVLVPVPLHPRRKRWRGFNQAEVLAKYLAQAWGWEVEKNCLKRVKDTSPQMTLSGRKRHENLNDAFWCDKNLVANFKRVMLVDDVATTCTTLNECSRMLKQVGANEVWGITLAQAVPK